MNIKIDHYIKLSLSLSLSANKLIRIYFVHALSFVLSSILEWLIVVISLMIVLAYIVDTRIFCHPFNTARLFTVNIVQYITLPNIRITNIIFKVDRFILTLYITIHNIEFSFKIICIVHNHRHKIQL